MVKIMYINHVYCFWRERIQNVKYCFFEKKRNNTNSFNSFNGIVCEICI